jgi:hypothetical protein
LFAHGIPGLYLVWSRTRIIYEKGYAVVVPEMFDEDFVGGSGNRAVAVGLEVGANGFQRDHKYFANFKSLTFTLDHLSILTQPSRLSI